MSHPDPIARETAIHAATTAALQALAALPDDAARDEARRRVEMCLRGATTPEAFAGAPTVTKGAPASAPELIAVLVAHRGNLAAVGRTYGKSRVQVDRWVRRYGIDVAEYRV